MTLIRSSDVFRVTYQLFLLVELEFLTRECRRQVTPSHNLFKTFLHKQRFHSGCSQLLRALLQRRNDRRVLSCYVVLLRRVLRDVVELHQRRQRGAPYQLPVALADRSAEGFDVVHDLGSRRWFALGDRAPNIEAVEWLTPRGRGAGQPSQCWIHVNDMNHFLHSSARRDVTWPVGERYHARATFIELSFTFPVWAVVARDFEFGHICNRA